MVGGGNVHVVLKKIVSKFTNEKDEKKKKPSQSLLRLCLHCGSLQLCHHREWW